MQIERERINKRNLFRCMLSKLTVVLGVMLLMPLWLSGQQLKVEATLSQDTIIIGDQCYYHLKIYKPEGNEVGFILHSNMLTEGVEILEIGEIDSSDYGNGIQELSKDFLITSFDSGVYELPPLKFVMQTNMGIDTFESNPLLLTVQTVAVDTSQAIKDIKLPYGAPVSFREVLPYLLILILVAGLGFLGWYLYKKYKNREPVLRRMKPKEPAHIIAFREFDRLKEDRLWQQEKIKDYYTRLTDILRNYLWHRFDIKTLERTSEEILDSMKNQDLTEDQNYRLVQDVFYLSDLAKFAKYKPIADDNVSCFEKSLKFVDQTKRMEEPKEEEELEIVEDKVLEARVEQQIEESKEEEK